MLLLFMWDQKNYNDVSKLYKALDFLLTTMHAGNNVLQPS